MADHTNNSYLAMKYLRQLKEQNRGHDIEVEHSISDDILCDLLIELGYTELVEFYKSTPKWYA